MSNVIKYKDRKIANFSLSNQVPYPLINVYTLMLIAYKTLTSNIYMNILSYDASSLLACITLFDI